MCIQVVPLGCGWPQIIDRHNFLRLARLESLCLTKQVSSKLHHTREVSLDIYAQMGRDQIEDVAAVTGSTVGPQPGLLTIEYHFQAVARATQHISNQKFPLAPFTSRKESGQNGVQSCDQIGTQRLTCQARLGR